MIFLQNKINLPANAKTTTKERLFIGVIPVDGCGNLALNDDEIKGLYIMGKTKEQSLNVQTAIIKKSQTFSEVDLFSFWQCLTLLIFDFSFVVQEWYLFALCTGILNMLVVLYFIRKSMLTRSWTKVKGTYQLFRLDTINIQRCSHGGPDIRYRPYCSYSCS